MESPSGMFWGVVLRPDKRYEQFVQEPFHVSKACLEPSKPESEAVTSVYIETDDEEYLLCNLNNKNLDSNLDLNFNAGDKIVLKTSGVGVVHLTGYNIMDDEENPMMFDDSDDDDGEEEESEDEEVPTLVNGKKRKMSTSPGDAALPAKKKNAELSPLDKLLANGKQAKAAKIEDLRKKLDAKKNGKKEEESSDEEDIDTDDVEEEEEDDDGDDSSAEFIDDEAEEDEEEEMETESPKKEAEAAPESGKKKKKQLNGAAVEADKVSPKKEPVSPKKEPANEATETLSAKKKKKNKKAAEAAKAAAEATPAKEGQKTPKPQKTPKRTLKGGIVAEDLKVGNGPEAKKGKMVGMYYEGKLKANDKQFDATLTGKPFKFRLGQGEVIKGWDIGVEGMKVGGKRRLTIPPNMGYGATGASPDIPPNAHLVFEVECKAVN